MVSKKKTDVKTNITAIDESVLRNFITDVDAKAKKQGEASMSIARMYKEFKQAYGMHGEAMKLIRKLNNMDEKKREEFLIAFDSYRHILKLGLQLGLFDEKGEPVAAEEGGDE